MKLIFVFLISLLLSLNAFGSLDIPQNQNYKDRITLLKILGLGTGAKILSNPFPLGGYSGFEVGISYETLATDDIATLGDQLNKRQSEFTYPKITLGKGLYNDFDVFINFTPFSESNGISNYGASFRWSFYEASFLPANLSLLIHGNNANINNQLNSQTFGQDLIGGIHVENFSLYLGIGKIDCYGIFVGGPAGITDQNNTVTENTSTMHLLAGSSVHFNTLFFSIQIDRYGVEPVFSAKLGLRL